jgi:DNA-binding MarR family transcriptional regulator
MREMMDGLVDNACGKGRGCESHEDELIRTIDKVICGYIRQEGDDLSVRQLAVLVQIAQQPMEITPLANSLRLSLSTVSRSIDALEKLKLARRARNGKFVTALATPLGHAKVGRLMANAVR